MNQRLSNERIRQIAEENQTERDSDSYYTTLDVEWAIKQALREELALHADEGAR